MLDHIDKLNADARSQRQQQDPRPMEFREPEPVFGDTDDPNEETDIKETIELFARIGSMPVMCIDSYDEITKMGLYSVKKYNGDRADIAMIVDDANLSINYLEPNSLQRSINGKLIALGDHIKMPNVRECVQYLTKLCHETLDLICSGLFRIPTKNGGEEFFTVMLINKPMIIPAEELENYIEALESQLNNGVPAITMRNTDVPPPRGRHDGIVEYVEISDDSNSSYPTIEEID